MTVSVTIASADDRRVIEGLVQFYVYDFSEMGATESFAYDFDARGLYPPLPGLAEYWSDPASHPLLIRVDGKPVGFALLNTHSHRGGRVERNMGEFFVARKCRRSGVATEALRQILVRYPGRWEVAVAERNEVASRFWPRAIAAAPNVSDLVRHDGDGVQWRGPIWSFLAR